MVKIKTNVTIRQLEIEDGDYYLKDIIEAHNIVTTAGLNLIRDWFYGAGETRTIKYIAYGGGSTLPVPEDVWLINPLGYIAVNKIGGIYMSTGRARMVGYLKEPDENMKLLKECGLTTGTNPSADILYARCVHKPLTKTKNNIISYTWDLVWELD
jgi:hypothetical protein